MDVSTVIGAIGVKQDVNSSHFKSDHWMQLSPEWQLTADWWRSSLKIRDKGETYLEKFKQEPPLKYEKRKWNSVPINYFRDTIDGLAGVVFRADPKPTDAHRVLQEFFNDVDLLGNSLHSFLLEAFKKFLRDGNGYIFVDAPVFIPDPEGVTPTLAQRENDRPWWIYYEASQIINYQETNENGKAVLSNITIETQTTEPSGRYGTKAVKRHRVYTRIPDDVAYTILVETEIHGKKEMIEESSGFLGRTDIPIVSFADWFADPPLMVLLLLNILHYNKTSDFDAWTHIACVPTKVYKLDNRAEAEEFAKHLQTVAVGMADAIWGEHSDVKFCEVSGSGLDIAVARYQEIEQQMVRIGGSMFQPTEIAPRTATEVMDSAGQRQSKLAMFARQFENAVEKVLYITAETYNSLQGAGTIDLNEQEKSRLTLKIDFDRLSFNIEQMQLFSQLVKDGVMSRITFLELLQKVTDMPEGWTVASEVAQLNDVEPPPMNLEAVA